MYIMVKCIKIKIIKEWRKTMKSYIDIILGMLLLIYIALINLMSSAKVAFAIPIVILGIMLIVYHFIKNKLRQFTYYESIKKVLIKLITVGCIIYAFIECSIIAYPKHSTESSEYIIVLGGALSNGKTPSIILQGRLDAAIECANEDNKNAYVVVSGGQGDDEKVSEAEAMQKYLIEHGIPNEKIILEDKSRNTNENFKYSKEKIEEHSNKTIDKVKVKIVTTDFHALRSRIIAKRQGYTQVDNYSSATKWYHIPINYAREGFAMVKTILFDR